MVRGRAKILLATALALIVVASAAAATRPRRAKAVPPSMPLQTAIFDPDAFSGAGAAAAFGRVRSTGANTIRLLLVWRGIVAKDPSGGTPPVYNWGSFDAQVRAAVDAGLAPIVDVLDAPLWARPQPDWQRPTPATIAAFAAAAASRYSGRTPGLPRVRYWQVWNEPNYGDFFGNEFAPGADAGPTAYRAIVNAFADAVHRVNRDNVVIAGGLAPFVAGTMAPLVFMQQALAAPIKFDVWSVHPYTWGGPTHQPATPDGISLGNLSAVRAILDTAQRARRIVSTGRPELWVTEFSYDTNPPDPKAIPMDLQVRWTSEALYRMWQQGVSLVTWFLLRDLPYPQQRWQSGLYFAGPTVAQDTPKPTLEAFRFPFVAFGGARGTTIWGRTPTSRPGTVVIDQQVGSGWSKLSVVKADRFGIFQTLLPLKSQTGSLRARFGAEASLPFGLAPVADQHIDPFGG